MILQGNRTLHINGSEEKKVNFSLSTSCIKLCEIIFSGMIGREFFHMFFPDNETRRKRNQQMPDFLNVLLFIGVLSPADTIHPALLAQGQEGTFRHC